MTARGNNKRLAAQGKVRQKQAAAFTESAANAIDRVIGRLWQQLLDFLRNRVPWSQAQATVAQTPIWADLPEKMAAILDRLAKWGWSAGTIDIKTVLSPDLTDMLFQAPTRQQIESVIFGGDWQARLRAATSLAAPHQLANVIGSGLAAGKSQAQIARDLLPLVDGVRSSARRVARTESMRVAAAMNMQAHEQLGDLVIGYQVHATLDQHTRPWHRARDGTIYYLQPQPGQRGPAQMPHPPDEPADPGERPPGAPSTAWNCRCWLSPVLRT